MPIVYVLPLSSLSEQEPVDGGDATTCGSSFRSGNPGEHSPNLHRGGAGWGQMLLRGATRQEGSKIERSDGAVGACEQKLVSNTYLFFACCGGVFAGRSQVPASLVGMSGAGRMSCVVCGTNPTLH